MVSSKNIPIATIFAALLVCIGVGLTICSEYILKTINLIFYEKIAMLKYNPDNDGIVVFYIHAQMMTLVLALLVLLIVFAGAMYPLFSSEWMGKLRGEKPCLAFLIVCVLFCAMWSFWTAEAVAGLYLANSSLRECSSYRFYAQKLPKSQYKFPFCLSLLRINDPFKRRICEPERINPYCDKIMTNTQLIYMLLVGGTSIATGGMFIFVICLSLNLILTRVESDFDVETVGSRRY